MIDLLRLNYLAVQARSELVRDRLTRALQQWAESAVWDLTALGNLGEEPLAAPISIQVRSFH